MKTLKITALAALAFIWPAHCWAGVAVSTAAQFYQSPVDFITKGPISSSTTKMEMGIDGRFNVYDSSNPVTRRTIVSISSDGVVTAYGVKGTSLTVVGGSVTINGQLYFWPSTATVGNCLQYGASGVLSWASCGSGSGGSGSSVYNATSTAGFPFGLSASTINATGDVSIGGNATFAGQILWTGMTASGVHPINLGDGTSSVPFDYGTVSGGHNNSVTASYGTVAGGSNGSAGDHSFVGGGFANTASGIYSAIPDGYNNTASGSYSFTSGYQMNGTGSNLFVWGKSGGNFQTAVNASDAAIFYNTKLGVNNTAPTYDLDVFGVARSSSSAYFATSNGNVGIGTTNPTTKLEVVGGSVTVGGNTIINSVGKIPALSSTYLASLDGSALINISTSTLASSTLVNTSTAALTTAINSTAATETTHYSNLNTSTANLTTRIGNVANSTGVWTNGGVLVSSIIFAGAGQTTAVVGGTITVTISGAAGGGGGLNALINGSYVSVSSVQATGDVVFQTNSSTWLIKVDLSTSNTRLNNLDSSTTTLTTRLNSHDTSTATLTTRLNNLDSSTGTLTTRLANLDSSTATLTTRLSNLDGSTATLTTQIRNVANSTGIWTNGGVLVSTILFSGAGQSTSVSGATITVTISGTGGSPDNLGTHVATTTLNMNGFPIVNISSIGIAGASAVISSTLTTLTINVGPTSNSSFTFASSGDLSFGATMYDQALFFGPVGVSTMIVTVTTSPYFGLTAFDGALSTSTNFQIGVWSAPPDFVSGSTVWLDRLETVSTGTQTGAESWVVSSTAAWASLAISTVPSNYANPQVITVSGTLGSNGGHRSSSSVTNMTGLTVNPRDTVYFFIVRDGASANDASTVTSYLRKIWIGYKIKK